MKKRFFLSVLFVLILSCIGGSYSSANAKSDGDGFSPDGTYTYLDTVDVVACAKIPIVGPVEYLNGSRQYERLGTKIIAVFSNDLMYEYTLLKENTEEELSEKGQNHIYHIKKGGVAVVKVQMTPDKRKIVEFVANIAL